MISNLPYRKNVVGIVKHKSKFLLLQLNDWREDFWKFPQGGVNNGEKGIDAIRREIIEELGTDDFLILKKFSFHHKYDWDKETVKKVKYRWRGQKQTFFLVEIADKKKIQINTKEVRDYCWASKKEVIKKIDVKHPIFKGYRKVIKKCLQNL